MRWKRNQDITPTYFSIEFGKCYFISMNLYFWAIHILRHLHFGIYNTYINPRPRPQTILLTKWFWKVWFGTVDRKYFLTLQKLKESISYFPLAIGCRLWNTHWAEIGKNCNNKILLEGKGATFHNCTIYSFLTHCEV